MSAPTEEDIPRKRQKLSPAIDVSAQSRREAEVGITELVNPGFPRFSGILKMRYTDFLVNEILPSGEVVHLENLRAPEKVSRGKAKSEVAQDSTQLPHTSSVSTDGKGRGTHKVGTLEPEQTLTDSTTSKVQYALRHGAFALR